MGLLGERKKKSAKGLHVNIGFFPLSPNIGLCTVILILVCFVPYVYGYIFVYPFKALAEGSLSLARAHAVLDETEKSLEHEIERESRKPPKSKIGKYVLRENLSVIINDNLDVAVWRKKIGIL